VREVAALKGPTRVPRSFPHPERGPSPPAPTRLHRLLQHRAATPIARQQQSPATSRGTPALWPHHRDSAGWRAPSPLSAGRLIVVGCRISLRLFASSSMRPTGGHIAVQARLLSHGAHDHSRPRRHEQVPFGTVKAINGNIRAMLRRGRGYRDHEYLLLKVVQTAKIPVYTLLDETCGRQ